MFIDQAVFWSVRIVRMQEELPGSCPRIETVASFT